MTKHWFHLMNGPATLLVCGIISFWVSPPLSSTAKAREPTHILFYSFPGYRLIWELLILSVDVVHRWFLTSDVLQSIAAAHHWAALTQQFSWVTSCVCCIFVGSDSSAKLNIVEVHSSLILESKINTGLSQDFTLVVWLFFSLKSWWEFIFLVHLSSLRFSRVTCVGSYHVISQNLCHLSGFCHLILSLENICRANVRSAYCLHSWSPTFPLQLPKPAVFFCFQGLSMLILNKLCGWCGCAS